MRWCPMPGEPIANNLLFYFCKFPSTACGQDLFTRLTGCLLYFVRRSDSSKLFLNTIPLHTMLRNGDAADDPDSVSSTISAAKSLLSLGHAYAELSVLRHCPDVSFSSCRPVERELTCDTLTWTGQLPPHAIRGSVPRQSQGFELSLLRARRVGRTRTAPPDRHARLPSRSAGRLATLCDDVSLADQGARSQLESAGERREESSGEHQGRRRRGIPACGTATTPSPQQQSNPASHFDAACVVVVKFDRGIPTRRP